MSFYKITDPEERRRMMERLTQTRKNVQDQFLEDKIGRIQSSERLKTFFKPVTESQRELTKEIKDQLVPIRDKVLTLPVQALAIQPATPTVETKEYVTRFGPIATDYLNKYLNQEEDVDTTFGIKSDNEGKWKFGNKEVKFDGNDLIIEEVKYPGTRGLWELIVSNEPSDQIYNQYDKDVYSEIMVKNQRDEERERPEQS